MQQFLIVITACVLFEFTVISYRYEYLAIRRE